ncbi:MULTISPECIES: HAD-IC family P-type ATPase [Spirulina sp. CCY15215]|uniref:HAD-IC family P-type ATPase n=1 Tax=Spirulina sp. CCY15215 TaxID=2767591 RepID=UPI0019529DE4|nr:HAD-IC family P-type ATPase [Spirulina major]
MTITYEKGLQTPRLQGLTTAEANENRHKHSSNILTPPERDSWWKLYLEKYEDPIIRILVVAAVISIAIGVINGQYIEGIGIIVAILLATTVAFINEYKANQEFDILNQVNNETPVKVVRNGKFTTVPKKDIVVGDIVWLETGDEIPADGQILNSVSLQVNEASLTGESKPVAKFASTENNEFETAYTPSIVLRGTT